MGAQTMTSPRGVAGILRALLICPSCRGELRWTSDACACHSCAHSYPILEGIPVMVPRQEGNGSSHKDAQASFFDLEADPEYEIERPHGCPAFHGWLLTEKFRRATQGLTDMLAGATALTVCGGSGMDAEFLAREGAIVISSDISLGGAQRTLERSRRHGIPIHALVADVENLPFPDHAVDLVLVHDGLHHIERPEVGLDEMARVAGKAVSVTEPARAAATAVAVRLGLAQEVEEAGNRVARLTPSQVSRQLRAHGLEVVCAERYAMYYGHEAGRPARLLSRFGLQRLGRLALHAFNAIAGGIGNKMTVQAIRPATSRGPGELPVESPNLRSALTTPRRPR